MDKVHKKRALLARCFVRILNPAHRSSSQFGNSQIFCLRHLSKKSNSDTL